MIAEKYESAADSADECLTSAREYVNRGTDQISNLIQDQPTRSVIVSCVAGFGVGLLLSKLIASNESSRSYSGFDRNTAERFGRNLLERVENALPSMLRDKFVK